MPLLDETDIHKLRRLHRPIAIGKSLQRFTPTQFGGPTVRAVPATPVLDSLAMFNL